ncbi:hypothetical protein DXG01_003396 [Tephrocybe rancida]|nr:hypothetical protein DXG01_003396 [Tephrocybe rancida]
MERTNSEPSGGDSFLWPEQYEHPHALIKNDLYTVWKSESGNFPPIPANPIPRDPESKYIQWAPLPEFKPMWIPIEHPFLAFIPRFKVFHGALLSRLAINERRVPLERLPDGTYILDKTTKDDWVALESNLRALAFALLQLGVAYTPQKFMFWPTPKRYGYEKSYRLPRVAKMKILQSRDAFVPLMATITMFLMIMDEMEALNVKFNWRKQVLLATQIKPQWLGALELSVIGDLTEPRIGGVIPTSPCPYPQLLPIFYRANLTIVLAWGDDPPVRPAQILVTGGVVPSGRVIQILRGRQLQYGPVSIKLEAVHRNGKRNFEPAFIGPRPDSDHRHLAFYSKSSPNSGDQYLELSTNTTHLTSFPPVNRNCGQRQGEHWTTFFERRQLSNQKREAEEFASDRAARQQREQNASLGRAPGKKGATVFYWDAIDGFRLRRFVERKNYDSYWDTYGPEQRRYDSFHNQWDVCTEFGEGDEIRYSDDDDDDCPEAHTGDRGHDTDFNKLLPEIDDPSDYHLQGSNSSHHDLQRLVQDEMFDVVAEVVTESAEETAQFRFGMNFVGDIDQLRTGKEQPWNFVARYVGNGRWLERGKQAEPSSKSKEMLRIFFAWMKSSAEPFDMPVGIYDALQDRSSVREFCPPFAIRRVKLNGIIHHLLRWPNTSGVELGLESAADLLQMLREEAGPTLKNVIRFCLDRGLNFHTFIRAPYLRTLAPPRSRISGLGFRAADYIPSVLDYHAYRISAAEFLQSPRGRAALMAGGIVARIAKDFINYECVFAIPSPEDVSDSENSICYRDTAVTSDAYWDDGLSDHEIRIICGSYSVATGKLRLHTLDAELTSIDQNLGQSDVKTGVQIAALSWFPPPSIWNTCGLNAGFWCADAEKWYMQRHLDCLAGTASSKNPALFLWTKFIILLTPLSSGRLEPVANGRSLPHGPSPLLGLRLS